MCNYLVFHNELKSNYLMEAIEKASRLSFYFAQAFYFYMNSLEKNISPDEIQVFKKVSDYNAKFLEEMNKKYEGQLLNSVEYFINETIKSVSNKSEIGYQIKIYGTKEYTYDLNDIVKSSDITLPTYSSYFKSKD